MPCRAARACAVSARSLVAVQRLSPPVAKLSAPSSNAGTLLSTYARFAWQYGIAAADTALDEAAMWQQNRMNERASGGGSPEVGGGAGCAGGRRATRT